MAFHRIEASRLVLRNQGENCELTYGGAICDAADFNFAFLTDRVSPEEVANPRGLEQEQLRHLDDGGAP